MRFSKKNTSLSTAEVYERTLCLFPTQTPSDYQEKAVFIEQINLEKIYELIRSELKVKTSNEDKHTFLMAYRNEVHQLFSDPAFLTLLMRSCSFVPLFFLETISESANQDCFASTIFSGRRQLSLPVSPSLRRAVAFF